MKADILFFKPGGIGTPWLLVEELTDVNAPPIVPPIGGEYRFGGSTRTVVNIVYSYQSINPDYPKHKKAIIQVFLD